MHDGNAISIVMNFEMFAGFLHHSHKNITNATDFRLSVEGLNELLQFIVFGIGLNVYHFSR